MNVNIIIIDAQDEIFINFEYKELRVRFLRMTNYKKIKNAILSEDTHYILILTQNELKHFNKKTLLQIKQNGIKIIIKECNSDSRNIIQTFQYGADGFLLEPYSVKEFYEAIDSIVNDRSILSSSAVSSLINSFRINLNGPLTDRENDVLQALNSGRSYKSIGNSLNISHDTVRTHVKHIYDKFGVNNRDKAMEKAELLNLI